MFEGIMFVEFCNDRGGAEDGSSFTVAIKGATEQDLKTLEENVYAAAETMTSYDSLEERVGKSLIRSGWNTKPSTLIGTSRSAERLRNGISDV